MYMKKTQRQAGPAPNNSSAVSDQMLLTQLTAGLDALGIALTEHALTQSMHYIRLLSKWNHAYNLTAITEPAAMIVRHLLDSYATVPYISGPRILDVGTGAGVPGIMLALARPEYEFVLLDSNGKKTRFVTQAVLELQLKNVAVVQERVEKFHTETLFDTVISRAFSQVKDMIEKTAHLCAATGRILAMKGHYPHSELMNLPDTVMIEAVHKLHVPGLSEERHIVCMRVR